MGNLDKALTTQSSVTDFMRDHQEDMLTLIAGLLDYGYSPVQTAGMTGVSLKDVYEVMAVNHFEAAA